jgi:hypothetical protein
MLIGEKNGIHREDKLELSFVEQMRRQNYEQFCNWV